MVLIYLSFIQNNFIQDNNDSNTVDTTKYIEFFLPIIN